MSAVVDRLAELTGFRDRDLLDVTLVSAMRDVLRPLEVAIYRVVGEPGEQRWHTRARLALGDAAPSADLLCPDPQTLPPLHAAPQRHECLRHDQIVVGSTGEPVRACFPLTDDREAVGVLEIGTERPLQDEEVRLISGVLRIYRNFQLLLDDSERDPLTRLLNRKTFDACFLRALAPQPAAAVPVEPVPLPPHGGAGTSAPRWRRVPQGRRAARLVPWLGVIDIDHFKRVNDTFGHLIGDEVLLLLSRLMRSSFRFHDHLFRFGGEEFVVLVRCPDARAAASVFERLRRNVEAYAFPQVGRITVSVGYTRLHAGDTPSGAFERADRAVYWAKQHGRNRIGDHAALVAGGELHDPARDNDVELF